MTENDIRNGLHKTESKKNGWQIVILEYDGKTVKGRYELKKWESGVHEKSKLPLETYRQNFIESLTRALVHQFIPPEDDFDMILEEEQPQ